MPWRRRPGRPGWLPAGFAGLAAALAGFGGSLHARPAVSSASLGLVAAFAYTVFPARQAQLARAGPGDSARLMAWNQGAMYVGITLGSLVGARVLATLGFAWLPVVCAALAAAGALASLGAPWSAASRRGGN